MLSKYVQMLSKKWNQCIYNININIQCHSFDRNYEHQSMTSSMDEITM